MRQNDLEMTKPDIEIRRWGGWEIGKKDFHSELYLLKNGFAILKPRWYDFFWKSPAVSCLEAGQR
jgi:hypothetical protein